MTMKYLKDEHEHGLGFCKNNLDTLNRHIQNDSDYTTKFKTANFTKLEVVVSEDF